VRKLDARGDDDGAASASAEPVLAALAGASVVGVMASGPHRGARPLRLGSGASFEATAIARRCAAVEGFSLHANVRVSANDRDGLEHLARYLARPPVATDRLTRLPDGRLALRFKRPLTDGTEAVVSTPFELIERLLPLIPRPRKHTIRFHGILAPAAGYRSKVVPAAETSKSPKDRPGLERPTPYRLPWQSFCAGYFGSTCSIARAVTPECASFPPSASQVPSFASCATWAKAPSRRRPPVHAHRRTRMRRPSGASSTSSTSTRRRLFVLTCSVGRGDSCRRGVCVGSRGPCFRPAGPGKAG